MIASGASLFVLLLILACFLSLRAQKEDDGDRRYVVLLDAGSTGTRIYIYAYDPVAGPLQSVKEVAHLRKNPALSTFYNNQPDLSEQMATLVDFAKQHVPQQEWAATNISLKATAGLRSLALEKSNWLISRVGELLAASGFAFEQGQTGVITGEEESLYDFLAITTAFRDHEQRGQLTFGAADLGGSSQQISFALSNILVPAENTRSKGESEQLGKTTFGEGGTCEPDWVFNNKAIQDVPLQVFTRSFQGMGLIAGMESVLNHFEAQQNNSSRSSSSSNEIDDQGNAIPESSTLFNPCVPTGGIPQEGKNSIVAGEGNFDACLELIRSVLVPKALGDKRCIRNHLPDIIVGMDNFPKVLEMLGLSNKRPVSPSQIRLHGRRVCSLSWTELLGNFPGYMPYRAQRACFGASYVYAMLVDIYSLDLDDNKSFLPLEFHSDGGELSWALGAAVYSALGL